MNLYYGSLCVNFCSNPLLKFLFIFLCADRCEPKGSLSGSNAGITSIEFDSAVSIYAISTVPNWE